MSEIHKAGAVNIVDVILHARNGTTFNILGQVINISIWEDIYQPCIRGTIYVLESLDIKNLFPLIGEELLYLHIKTPSLPDKDDIKQTFYIYSIKNQEMIGEKSICYAISFVSVEAITDVNKKISKTFSGQVSSIANNLITNTNYFGASKLPLIEDTISTTKYISNFWSPLKNIQYLVDTAVNGNHAANYLFFENRYHNNFVSFDYLINRNELAQNIRTFNMNQFVRDIDPTVNTSSKDINKEYEKILDIKIPKLFDYIERSVGGMFANKLITVDPITKKYSDTNYYLRDEENKLKHLNPFPLSTANPIATAQQLIIYMPKHYGNFNGYADVTNASSIQARTSQMKLANANSIEITTYGRTDYTVGMLVNISVPNSNGISEKTKNNVDNITSGKYLVSKIFHDINFNEHITVMEVIKDSLIVNPNLGRDK